MTKAFDYVNSISYNKKDLWNPLEESSYEPYFINLAFSQYPDTLLIANEMNLVPHVPKHAHYQFMLNTIRPKKRFSKWSKYVDSEDLGMICEVYNCNRTVGKQYLSLLSKEDIETIRAKRNKGG